MSEEYLMQLWRMAVKKKYGDMCIFCKKHPVECHHIISRRFMLTRYMVNNGTPLCVDCHKIVDTKAGKDKLKAKLGDRYKALIPWEWADFRHYLDQEHLTRDEWLELQKRDLLKILKER